VAQDRVKARSISFPALWVEGEGVSVRTNVAKMFCCEKSLYERHEVEILKGGIGQNSLSFPDR